MERHALILFFSLGSVVLAGKDTDEELAHYVKNYPTTDVPWTSKERRINKMIEEEIEKYNRAPETTECPFDSQGKPKPTEGKEPTWWNAYRQAKDGDRPDWSAEIKELIKNPRTYPPWTPSQESEPIQSRWKNIEPFTWRPGAPVINLRIKTDATTRPSGTQEPTTERSMVLSSAHWDTSEEGGGGTEPSLNLAPLQKGYQKNDDYLKVKPRKKSSTISVKTKDEIDYQSKKGFKQRDLKRKHNEKSKQSAKSALKEDKKQREVRMRRERSRRERYNTPNHNFARF